MEALLARADKGKLSHGFVLHHKDPELRDNDPERYYEWRVADLELMTRSEHTRFHRTGYTRSQRSKESYEQVLEEERNMVFAQLHDAQRALA